MAKLIVDARACGIVHRNPNPNPISPTRTLTRALEPPISDRLVSTVSSCRDAHHRHFGNGATSVAETVAKTVAQTVPEPEAEPVPEPVLEPVPEPVPEPVAETVAEPVAETVAETVEAKTVEAMPEATASRKPRHRLALKRAGLPPEAIPKLALLPPEVSGLPLLLLLL